MITTMMIPQIWTMINEWWNKLPKWLRNHYAITVLLFFVWMAFFDQDNMINQIELKAELFQLDSDKAYYQHAIIETREDLDELLADNSKLERFAREKYFMKKENEEIFVFVSQD